MRLTKFFGVSGGAISATSGSIGTSPDLASSYEKGTGAGKREYSSPHMMDLGSSKEPLILDARYCKK